MGVELNLEVDCILCAVLSRLQFYLKGRNVAARKNIGLIYRPLSNRYRVTLRRKPGSRFLGGMK